MSSTNGVQNVKNWVNRAEMMCQERWLMHNHISFAVNILLNKNQKFESIVISTPENTPFEKVLKSKWFTSMIKPSIEETLWSVRDLPEEELADKIDEIRNRRVNLIKNKRKSRSLMCLSWQWIQDKLRSTFQRLLIQFMRIIKLKQKIKGNKFDNGYVKPPTPAFPG